MISDESKIMSFGAVEKPPEPKPGQKPAPETLDNAKTQDTEAGLPEPQVQRQYTQEELSKIYNPYAPSPPMDQYQVQQQQQQQYQSDQFQQPYPQQDKAPYVSSTYPESTSYDPSTAYTTTHAHAPPPHLPPPPQVTPFPPAQPQAPPPTMPQYMGQPMPQPSYLQQPEKKDKKFLFGIIIVVIIAVIAVIAAPFLLGYGSDDNGTSDNSELDDENIQAITRSEESTKYWTITIDTVTADLDLNDATFKVITDNNDVEYIVTTGDADPASIYKDDSVIYPLTKGGPVLDLSTNSTVNSQSSLSDFDGCYMIYVDSNSDLKITEGDAVIVFKDYDANGLEEIKEKYQFGIFYNDRLLSSVVL